jgi:hypothetical protein
MRILLIGGTFDRKGGKTSHYIEKVIDSISLKFNWFDYFNGGFFFNLESIINSNNFVLYDVILWFPNVPNEEEKIVNKIKEKNPTCILVTSKNNRDNKYNCMDIISRALQTKSNLIIEFWQSTTNMINVTILDPLGNCFIINEVNIEKVVYSLFNRIVELLSFHRIPSIKVGDSFKIPSPENAKFIEIINEYANEFHELIHGLNTSRFLGNASYRCERGFPSMKVKDKVFVSKRNIDKRDLSTKGFIACNLNSAIVEYYGEHKPSVDSPIQLSLYNFYKNINYMIHSHVYIKNAPFTHSKIPCGALEEATEIINMFPYENIYGFHINLKGHGSLIASSDLSQFNDIKFFSRPIPEI